MYTDLITSQRLAASVIAVPPLARRSNLTIDRQGNARLIRYLEGGGVSTLPIHPISGLHRAVSPSRIAETGPLLPLLQEISDEDRLAVQRAVDALLDLNDLSKAARNDETST